MDQMIKMAKKRKKRKETEISCVQEWKMIHPMLEIKKYLKRKKVH
jgi:hypothetical protein